MTPRRPPRPSPRRAQLTGATVGAHRVRLASGCFYTRLVGSWVRGLVLWWTGGGWFRSLAEDSWVGRRVAGRFVAGASLDDAMGAARGLDRSGIGAMLDHLGENVDSPAGAGAAADAYVRAVKRIHESDDLDCNLAVKLTQLGLDLGEDVCLENMERVLEAAAARGTLVMIDMEAS